MPPASRMPAALAALSLLALTAPALAVEPGFGVCFDQYPTRPLERIVQATLSDPDHVSLIELTGIELTGSVARGGAGSPSSSRLR